MKRSADGYRQIVQYKKKKKWRAAARQRSDWRTQKGEGKKVTKSHRKKEDFLPPGLLARQPNPTHSMSLFHWNNFNVCVYLCITVLTLNVYCSYKWHLRKLIKNKFKLNKNF